MSYKVKSSCCLIRVCDKARRIDTLGWDESTLTKSQVIGICSLRAVGYTLGL
jgi:hypothetical protein